MKKRKRGLQKKDLKSRKSPDETAVNDLPLSPLELMTCRRCGATLLGPRSIRLKSRPKMGHKMQKLLRKKRQQEFSLTKQQETLLQKSMKWRNQIVLKCTQCQWARKQLLQTRAAYHRQKLPTIKENPERMLSAQPEDPGATDKKAKQRIKKKARRKKAAASKALELQAMQSKIKAANALLAASSTCKAGEGKTPVPATPPLASHLQAATGRLSVSRSDAGDEYRGSDSGRTNSPHAAAKPRVFPKDGVSLSGASKKPMLTSACASSASPIHGGSGTGAVSEPVRTVTSRPKQSKPPPGLQGGKLTQKGRRTLQKMLGQKQPGTPSVKDSLSAFLDSLK